MKIPNFSKVVVTLSLMIAGTFKAECVLNGMNLWQLAECIACSAGAYFEIKQSNFVAAVCDINAPGHYKLCENVSGLAIQINTSGVILDLGGYTTTSLIIVLQNGVSSVVIRNGTMKNTNLGIDLIDNNNKIVIEDLVIDTLEPFATNEFAVIGTSVDGVLIRNVTVYNGSFRNFRLIGSNITLENITCIKTNPAFSLLPGNPDGIIYLKGDNLVLRNITLIDQYQELNGIWFDTCSNIDVDGVSITSSLAAPTMRQPLAYNVADSTVGLHRNVFVDGGENAVFAFGILDSSSTNSTENIFDTCFVTNVSVTAFQMNGTGGTALNSVASQYNVAGFDIMKSNVVLRNCTAKDGAQNGFDIINSNATLLNCSALNNEENGFNADVAAVDGQYNGCYAEDNDNGFFISGDGCSLDSCTANNNATDGFFIDVLDGCFITNSIANDNGQYGFHINNIGAEANFAGGNPVNGTWNIGQTAKVNFTTTSRNVRLANNTALRNALIPGVLTPGGFVMSGQVFTNNGGLGSPQAFTTQIFPPIGVLNTIQGIIYMDPKPISSPPTSLGASTGFADIYANTRGGNLVNDKP